MTFTEKRRDLLSKIELKTVETDYGIPYEVYTNTPKAIRIKESDINKRVWVADTPRTHNYKLIGFNENGEAIIKQNRGGQFKTVFIEEIILHPMEWKGRI